MPDPNVGQNQTPEGQGHHGPQKMGLLYGLEKQNLCIKRQNRWLFMVPGVCADDTPGVDALPPDKSARPNLGFKEMEAKHLTEDIYYPCRPDWKPITLTLFDLVKPTNPVFEWIKKVYDPQQGQFLPAITANTTTTQPKNRFIKTCYLKEFSGCGDIIETWVFEDCWPNAVNYQTLDMGSAAFLVIELTLRYARAFLQN